MHGLWTAAARTATTSASPIIRGPMDRWPHGRITLLGDACHPKLPTRAGRRDGDRELPAFLPPACTNTPASP